MKVAVKNNEKNNNVSYVGNPFIKMIENKLNDDSNNYCVECGNQDPEYISINNGVFICKECVPTHLKFSKNISKILNNNKNKLTLTEIQYLLCGGNKALLDFINNEFPKLSDFPPNVLYRTQAMVYYRQNLQYLITGGIPPIKPSDKYAYKIANILNDTNENYNTCNFMLENECYCTIFDEKEFKNKINYINNYEKNLKFYNSGYNFRAQRANNNKQIFNNIYKDGNKFNNYFISTPKHVNLKNNNNIMINNIYNNNNIMYSPKKIQFNFKQNQKKKFTRNQISHSPLNDNNTFFKEIYVKPKLIISPNLNRNYSLDKNEISQRNSSADIIKKNHYKPLINDISENNIISIELNNSNKIKDNKYNKENQYIFEYNFKHRKMIKNLSEESYIKTKPIKCTKKNKCVHKSFSQKIIKNEVSSSMGNKYIMPMPTENSFFQHQIMPYNNRLKKTLTNTSCLNKNKFKISGNDNEQIRTLPKKRTLNNFNINYNNNLIKNILKNNEKFSSAGLNFYEIESLPIKINLKTNQKTKVNKDLNKGTKEKNYLSLDKIKNESKKSNKNKKENNSKIENKIKIDKKQKENKKQEINLDKKKIIKAKKHIINKNKSQDNIKELKEYQKRLCENICNDKGEKKFSIRNKYKQNSKNK